ncbi:hypothetical protein B0H13DRAFT_2279991 [Mycena leptocephala]|nr:hypothetical protein B0H13DRAFT_2279991 [Mycena leptocephala]
MGKLTVRYTEYIRLPSLIEETDDAPLRWKYRSRVLRDSFYRLVPDAESWIEEGVPYFDAGSAPVGQAVQFYNAVASHYTAGRYLNLSKATEFNKWAFTLAQQTNDIDLQLAALDIEQQLATRSYNPHWIIEVVHKPRSITRFRSTRHWEHSWLEAEAWAHFWIGNLNSAPDLGGTLSECAAREHKGGTFHFGNVPGLAPTTLGKDTYLFFNRAPPLYLLPPSPLTPNGHPRVENTSKCPPPTNSSWTSIDRLPYIFLYQIQDSAALPVGLAVGDSRLNGIRMARVLSPKPDSKAEYDLVILALIAVDQEDEGRVKSSPLSVDNYRDTDDRNVSYTLVQISMNFGWFQSRLSFNTQARKEWFAANMICSENRCPFKISSVSTKAAIHSSQLDLGTLLQEPAFSKPSEIFLSFSHI